jgi:hypothetical protein
MPSSIASRRCSTTHQKQNLASSFAIFTGILLCTKQRAWVGGESRDRPPWFDRLDHAARNAREALRDIEIFDPPWLLSRSPPKVARNTTINSGFDGMNAEQFIKWLRDALAHGDGRSIKPLHKLSPKGKKTLLVGFRIAFRERRGSDRNPSLYLYHQDMKRMGGVLADAFCRALGGGDRSFERVVGNWVDQRGFRDNGLRGSVRYCEKARAVYLCVAGIAK